MGHTPYGYRIENGIAVIDKTTANQVQQLYKTIYADCPLQTLQRKQVLRYFILVQSECCKTSTILEMISILLSSPKKLLCCYSRIKQTFRKLGRNNRYQAPIIKRPPTTFRIDETTEKYDNLIRQAEYCYSLIESVVIE